MRLSELITRNIEKILAEWEAFAKTTLPAAETMDFLALRDLVITMQNFYRLLKSEAAE